MKEKILEEWDEYGDAADEDGIPPGFADGRQ
jgi:hypothetical protein